MLRHYVEAWDYHACSCIGVHGTMRLSVIESAWICVNIYRAMALFLVSQLLTKIQFAGSAQVRPKQALHDTYIVLVVMKIICAGRAFAKVKIL